MGRHVLGSADAVAALANRLSGCAAVSKYDTAGNEESWTIAHAFTDLEESFRTFIDEQLPKLVEEDLDEAAVEDLLLDIGEELRHVLYHIRDTRFFRYVWNEESTR